VCLSFFTPLPVFFAPISILLHTLSACRSSTVLPVFLHFLAYRFLPLACLYTPLACLFIPNCACLFMPYCLSFYSIADPKLFISDRDPDPSPTFCVITDPDPDTTLQIISDPDPKIYRS
jgi:hypothetical protein